MLNYKATQHSPALRSYMARICFRTPELLEFLICVIAQPLAVYISTPDQRLREFGLCIFDDREETI